MKTRRCFVVWILSKQKRFATSNDAYTSDFQRMNSDLSPFREKTNFLFIVLMLIFLNRDAATTSGMTVLGNDLSSEMGAGVRGVQISIDSASAAKDVATEVVRLKKRIVIFQMFHTRNRLVLPQCSTFYSFVFLWLRGLDPSLPPS